MMESNELVTQQQFETRYPLDHSWLKWMMNTSKHWIWPASTSNHLIVVSTVKAIAKSILDAFYQKQVTSWLDSLFTFHEFKAKYGKFNDRTLSDADMWLVLRYLSYEIGLGIVESVQLHGTMCTAIKFPDRASAQKQVELTENDKAVIGLKTTRVALLGRIDELQRKSDEFLEMARTHYKQQHKPQAAYMLKKRKQIESILEQKLKTVETIETILLKLETSQNDIQVVQAFNLGADALRGLMKHVNANTVDETMNKVMDAIEDQKDVESAVTAGSEQVASAIFDTEQYNDEELEKELELLLANDELDTSTKMPEPKLNDINASFSKSKRTENHESNRESESDAKPKPEKVAIPL
ncbi:hypothetical protein K501DRAFT_237672 [Backusella circina FSU 941]|nr:hypothetical protein K501DRAFT_237672 [Backusella circina FSU 941]